MYLRRLQLTDFRNYQALDLAFGDGEVQVIFGDNAQGKTNLLEAVHYLALLRTFRGQSSRDLIRFGAEAARVAGEVVGDTGVDELAVGLSGETRKLTLNGREPPKVADYLATLAVVRFIPDDIVLLKGPSAPRRRMLDRAVFNLFPSHLSALQDYNKALAQRNRLLRDRWTDPDLLESWNERLLEPGAAVVASRLAYRDRIAPLVGDFFGEISASGLRAEVSYKTRLGELDELPRDAGGLKDCFREALARTREEESRRGFTVVGPHRDDLILDVGGHAVKRYGSQGQHRMVALALKVAEIVLYQQERGDYPVLLLDDVRSELDADRVRYLFTFLNRIPAQILVTSTDFRELSGEITRPARLWKITAGQVDEQALGTPPEGALK